MYDVQVGHADHDGAADWAWEMWKMLLHMSSYTSGIFLTNSDATEFGEIAAPVDYEAMLQVAIAEARLGLAEGGIPIGAAMFDNEGLNLLSRGHNRRVQENDPSMHAETDAFRKAGRRRRSYRDTIMVTTLAPCWYCSGLVRQFGIGTLVVGESVNFQGGGVEWLRESAGVKVIDLQSAECVGMLADYVAAHPDVWNEDIGKVD